MKNYTIIPNEIFEASQLSARAKFLYCILLKFCGKGDSCYPGQTRLATIMGYKDARYIRTIVKELKKSGLISVKRTGYGKTNRYKVSKDLYGNNSSYMKKGKGNESTPHIGSAVPLRNGISVPPNITQEKGKDKNREKSLKALDRCRAELTRKGILATKPPTISENHLLKKKGVASI